MPQKSASFVLGSSKSSTDPRGSSSGFDLPAALLNELFEHPVVNSFSAVDSRLTERDSRDERDEVEIRSNHVALFSPVSPVPRQD